MTRPSRPQVELLLSRLDAVIFDMDGVVTRTASLHAAAWKQLFDAFLRHKIRPEEAFRPFDIEEDYRRYVDGKSRYDGVASFLASRGMSLPQGKSSDPPSEETICGLGNLKDGYFRDLLGRQGIGVFESTVDLIRNLKSAGLKVGIFSASRNAGPLLTAAGVRELFDAKVDGVDSEELGLAGKPNPATLLELARRLAVEPGRTAVVEDAIAGVQAGKAGQFAFVIGVNRSLESGRLLENGASLEVADLDEIRLLP